GAAAGREAAETAGREALETTGREVAETTGRETAEQAARTTGEHELSTISTNAAENIKPGELVPYDPDFAMQQVASADHPTASQLDEFGASQSNWTRSQTEAGPIKYTDENGINRLTIKKGSPRTPGSENPHIEMKGSDGQRFDKYGFNVTRRSPGNHTPIEWDLP
ncbi:hypothetical protein, partial [Propionibacterium acidifaciens]|uniref:hypothetical protein n=1 Tax=Propionibacterium acidifaciens TaxID=556499 RepID=UPI0023F44660